MLQAQVLKAGAAEVEHIRGRFALKQVLYFFAIERLFKEITLVDFASLVRKELFRLSAGVSLYPAIKIDLHFMTSSP